MLDAIKAQGYKYSTLSAISVAVCDAVIPPQKAELIGEADKQVSQVGQAVQPRPDLGGGALQETIDIWQAPHDKVSKAWPTTCPRTTRSI